jgi:hypothetical protein
VGVWLQVRWPAVRLPAPSWLHLQRDPLAPDPWPDSSNFIKRLSPLDRYLGGICPPFCLGSCHGGRLLLAGWWSLDVTCVMLVLRLCRSCRGQTTFGKTAVGGILSSLPSSGSPRWSRQSAAAAAGPSVGADLLNLAPCRFLEHQPAESAALGMPQKSSPRQRLIPSLT